MRSKRQRQRTTAIAVAATMACLVVGFVLFAKPWQANNDDPKTSCPKDGQYPRTVILIDATDSLSKRHIEKVQSEADNLSDQLDLHEWVGVFVLDDENLVIPEPLIARCNPGNEQTANPLYQNPKLVQRKFENTFAKPLRGEIEKLASLPEQEESPIMEMILAVSRQFDNASQKKRRLIIVSDMLQHTKAYSHYKDSVAYDKWRQTKHARGLIEDEGLSLKGVTVEMWYVTRGNLRHLQTRGHVSFWENLFTDVGASASQLKRI